MRWLVVTEVVVATEVEAVATEVEAVATEGEEAVTEVEEAVTEVEEAVTEVEAHISRLPADSIWDLRLPAFMRDLAPADFRAVPCTTLTATSTVTSTGT